MPVWSLSTKNSAGNTNFNICTYVTSVSMEPKLMLVALYNGTKTLENVQQTNHGLLQLLTQDLAPVVRVCGQMSGHGINKYDRLLKRYAMGECAGLPFFKAAAGYMELSFTSLTPIAGDHVLAVAQVVQSINCHDTPILTTDYLKEHKFIR